MLTYPNEVILISHHPIINFQFIFKTVIFDISGSTAFWENDAAAKDLVIRARDQGLLKYVVVMGSVVTTEEPKTMAVPGALIRHPMATMNQLYDPLSFRNIAEALSSGPQWVLLCIIVSMYVCVMYNV